MTTVRGQERATDTSASVPLLITRRGDGVGVQAREGRADRDIGPAPDVGGGRGRDALDAHRAGRQDRAHPHQPEEPRQDGDDREPPGRQRHGRRRTAAARAAKRDAGGGEADGAGPRRKPSARAPRRQVAGAAGSSASPPGPRRSGRSGSVRAASRRSGRPPRRRSGPPARPPGAGDWRSASRRSTSGPTMVTSPAPTVSTRSPGRTRPATVGARLRPGGDVVRSRRDRPTRSATRAPLTPGHGVLPCGVDVHDDDHVGGCEGGARGLLRSRGCASRGAAGTPRRAAPARPARPRSRRRLRPCRGCGRSRRRPARRRPRPLGSNRRRVPVKPARPARSAAGSWPSPAVPARNAAAALSSVVPSGHADLQAAHGAPASCSSAEDVSPEPAGSASRTSASAWKP